MVQSLSVRPVRYARFVLALAAAVAVGCGDTPTAETGDGPPASISLNTSTIEIFTKETQSLKAAVRDADGNVLSVSVSWSSSNRSVAEVNTTGVVTGVAPGTATIEALVNGLSASATVTVLETMGFTFPLVGTLNQAFYYVNYVDQELGVGIRDYHCGLKTYDGHRGIDLTLPSFAWMDAGVAVLATAPGTISMVHDGEADRNKSRGSGGFGNHVRVSHRDGFESIYAHLARQSITVSLGQQVTAGATLGLVGSSGNSDMPHLHIEFRRNGETVDAFAGSCGPTFTQWAAPDAYQDAFMLIASGTSNLDLSVNLLKDPPRHVDTFTTSDARAAMWVQLYNVRAGNASRFELYDPGGALFWSFRFVHDVFYSMSWWFAWHTVSGSMTQTGTWRYDYYNGSDLLASHTFELVPATPPARAQPPQPGAPRSGIAGGGLRRGTSHYQP